MKNADVPHIKGVCQVCTHIQVTERIPMTQHIFLQQETKSTFFRTEVLHFVHFIGPTFCRLCPSQKLYHRSKSLKNSWFFLGSMSDPPAWRLWHHMQNCITCWYYITVTLHHIFIYIYYIYIYSLYRCTYIHTCCMSAMMMLFQVNGWFRFKSPLLWVETPFRPVATGCRGWGPSSRDVGRRKSHQTGGSRCCSFFVRKIL